MIEVGYTKSFEKAFKKRIKPDSTKLESFYNKLELFISNPYHPQLRAHKLSGNLKDIWSFSIGYDLRVVFYFETSTRIVFMDVGTHDEVY